MKYILTLLVAFGISTSFAAEPAKKAEPPKAAAKKVEKKEPAKKKEVKKHAKAEPTGKPGDKAVKK